MKGPLRFASYTWQILQNITGLGVLALCRASGQKVLKKDGIWYVDKLFGCGVCLGDYIIFQGSASERDIAHERGHQKQSRILGPLYLPVVGLPSALLNLASRKSPRLAKRYYRRFPEAWADYLGGVKRDN